MADPYVGEIRMAGFNFAPLDWAFCDGRTLPIDKYETLFALIGTTYGGDGIRSFALPNLLGRVPIHQGKDLSGNVYVIGQTSGSEGVSLTVQQMPSHNHAAIASSNPGARPVPVINDVPAQAAVNIYAPGANLVPMGAITGPTGGGQPHENVMPYQCVNYIISLYGIFPSQS